MSSPAVAEEARLRHDPPDAATIIARLEGGLHAGIRELESQQHDLVGEGEARLCSRLIAYLGAQAYAGPSETDEGERALQRAESRGHALLLARLDELRGHLVRIDEHVGILGNEDVREAITDKAAEYVAAKRKKSFQTRLQLIVIGLATEAPKNLPGRIGRRRGRRGRR